MAELPPNVWRTRVRMYHTDLTGIFHGRIFELFEEARTEVFRRLGYAYGSSLAAGLVMVVTACGASFSSPLRLVDEEIDVAVFIAHRSRVRITVAYELRRRGEARPAAAGHTAFTFLDTARNRPVPVPANVRAAIARCPEMVRDGGAVS